MSASMSRMESTLRTWIPLAAAITIVCGLVYLAMQQGFRHGANDPQIQLAEDAAGALARGGSAGSVLPGDRIDIAGSLAPFVCVYDADGKPLDSSGLLHGQPPALPPGVFAYARAHGEDRITWQPEPGVRVAAVVVANAGARPGFVLAGRSLREAERRTGQAEAMVGAGWIATLLVSLIAVGACAAPFAGTGGRPPAGR